MERLPSIEELKQRRDDKEASIRAKWVRTMEIRLVRDEIAKCQKAEGVNHYAVCKPIVETYLELFRGPGRFGVKDEA